MFSVIFFILYCVCMVLLVRYTKKATDQLLAHLPTFLVTTLVATTSCYLLTHALTPHQACIIFLLHILLLVSYIDIKTHCIPDTLSLGGMWAGLMLATSPSMAIQGAFLGYTLPWAIAQLHSKLRSQPLGMGHGDFKLLAMLGAWLGPARLIPLLSIASTAFILFFILFAKRNNLRQNTPIPFGPFISFSALLSLLIQNRLN